MAGTDRAEEIMDKGQAGDGTSPAARREIKRLSDAGMALVAISEALGRISEDASRSSCVIAQIQKSEIANPPESLIRVLRPIKPPEALREAAAGDFRLLTVLVHDPLKSTLATDFIDIDAVYQDRVIVREQGVRPGSQAGLGARGAPLFGGVRVFTKSDEEHVKGKGKDFVKLIDRITADNTFLPVFLETLPPGFNEAAANRRG